MDWKKRIAVGLFGTLGLLSISKVEDFASNGQTMVEKLPEKVHDVYLREIEHGAEPSSEPVQTLEENLVVATTSTGIQKGTIFKFIRPI